MSEPVFVCDAQGKLLLPTSVAYAEKLIQSGHATRRPHYAFRLLKLNQAIVIPSLRSIVVGVTLYRQSAELVVVVDRAHMPQVLLYLIVDLRSDHAGRIRQHTNQPQRRSVPQRSHTDLRCRRADTMLRPRLVRLRGVVPLCQRSPRVRGAGCIWTPMIRWRARVLTQVIGIVQSLVPLTHVVVLSPRHTGDRPNEGARSRIVADRSRRSRNETGRVLIQKLQGTALILHWATNPQWVLEGISPMVTNILHLPPEALGATPFVVLNPRTPHRTVPLPRSDRRDQIGGPNILRRGRTAQDRALITDRVVRIGMLCEARRAENTVRGIVVALYADGRIGLAVLARITPQCVRWRRIVVNPRHHFRVLANQSIVFVATTERAPYA